MQTEQKFSSCRGSETAPSLPFTVPSFPKQRRGRPRKDYSMIIAQSMRAKQEIVNEWDPTTPFHRDELVSLDDYQQIVDNQPLDAKKEIKTPQKPNDATNSRRRLVDPSTCEKDYSTDEVEFMNALEEYKRASGRLFPTCTEILDVLRGLGYEKSFA